MLQFHFIIYFKMNARTVIARELHRQARKNYPRRHVELKGVSDLYQGDLVEMIPFFRINKGYKYIMTIINCFTKYAIAVPLKSKSAPDIVTALEPILKIHPMKHFQTDDGKEWFNSKVLALLKLYNINHYSTFSGLKASIIERWNRTLKTQLYRLFSEQGSFRWLEILPKLVKNYNNSFHRTIGMKPVEVNVANEKTVLLKMISNRRKKNRTVKIKFEVGDLVRISRQQSVFTKGYLPRWSNEIYSVWRVQPTVPVTYVLKDTKGEILKGGFYQQELNKTKVPDTYLIEKVVKRQGDRLLVRWLGFDKTHDSWINKKDLLQ